MTQFLFSLPERPSLAVMGKQARFPVHRVFCVGRNYAAHAAEMGGEVDREAPWYFTKAAAHVALSGQTLPYPPGTSDYHHEVEFALALGAPVFEATEEQAEAAIYGYACALDMTRRDRQQDGKDHRRPWDLGKDVEGSAILGALTRKEEFGPVADQRIHLMVNGQSRQNATLADMVWSCPEIVAHLSRYYHLVPGDVILTGTPAGVGPVRAGDQIIGSVEGLSPVTVTLSEAA
ncbi:MAG: fumarylacetoacetase [Rhodobacterales bacterium]|nr:MAG: fumarylacetoacetase [Rhodobacterales bacterium]